MILTGILIAAGIIGGVTALQQQGIIATNSPTVTTTSFQTQITVSTTTQISTSQQQLGVLAVQITDPSNVPTGTEHVFIGYSDIEAHTTTPNGDSIWYTLASAGSIDLMSVANVGVTLGSAKVPSGNYDQVRFNLLYANVTYNGRNFSASMPISQFSLPIQEGGIAVQTNQSSGLLVELSPTLFPSPTTTRMVSFTLIPALRTLSIPTSDWNSSLVQKGSELNITSKSWWLKDQSVPSNNLNVLTSILRYDYALLVLQNTGNSSITLSSISVLSNSPEASANVTITTIVSTITTVTTITKIVPSADEKNNLALTESNIPLLSNGWKSASPAASSGNLSATSLPFQTVATLEILSNGSVIQPNNLASLQVQAHSGFMIPPGQTVALLFHQEISTLSSSTPPYKQLSIVSGVPYVMRLADPYGYTFDINVTASY